MSNLHYQLSWSKNYLLIPPPPPTQHHNFLKNLFPLQNIWLFFYKSDRLTATLADWLTDRLTVTLIEWLNDCLIDWLTKWLSHWLTDWPTNCHTDWLTDWLLESCRNRMATHSISRKRLTCFFILSRLDRSCWVVQLLRYEDRHSARRHYHQEVLSLNLGYFYQQYLILSVQFYVLFWALFNWVS